jgi:RHS repeat-associated protein
VLVAQYEYDANGNRIRFVGTLPADTATGSYDDQDRLRRLGDTTFGYTANGDLALRVTGADTTQYSYDPFGNLITVRLSSGDRIDYLVDGANRRVVRKLNGSVTTAWLYQSGSDPVAELDGTGAVIARYIYGTRAHVPDYVVKGDSTYRLLSDHLGSIRQVVNVTSGFIAEERDYDAWGRVTLDTAPGLITLGYAGGLTDPLTTLIRFGARDYDPTVGRWCSRDADRLDPVVLQTYEYAASDPLNFIDPEGDRALPIPGPPQVSPPDPLPLPTPPLPPPQPAPPVAPVITSFALGYAIGSVINYFYEDEIQDWLESRLQSDLSAWDEYYKAYSAAPDEVREILCGKKGKKEYSDKGGHRTGKSKTKWERHSTGAGRGKRDKGGEKKDPKMPYRRK